jgi:hypothetical protein
MPSELDSEPFSFEELKDDRVHIFHDGKLAKVLKGTEAVKFIQRMEQGDVLACQRLMARVTGQYKFGNER